MESFLIILAIFLGLLAFGFCLAGILGLLNLDRQDSQGLIALDALLTGGAFTKLGEVIHNWPHRREQRLYIYISLTCGLFCILSLIGALRAN